MVLPDADFSIDGRAGRRTDDPFARATAEGFGAFIFGRNLFGPAGNGWGGPEWKGWWGDNPPYHAPTFILTHHAKARRRVLLHPLGATSGLGRFDCTGS